jgi:hypothetical protein
MDHALGGNYPLESAWKVIEEVDGLTLLWATLTMSWLHLIIMLP